MQSTQHSTVEMESKSSKHEEKEKRRAFECLAYGTMIFLFIVVVVMMIVGTVWIFESRNEIKKEADKLIRIWHEKRVRLREQNGTSTWQNILIMPVQVVYTYLYGPEEKDKGNDGHLRAARKLQENMNQSVSLFIQSDIDCIFFE